MTIERLSMETIAERYPRLAPADIVARLGTVHCVECGEPEIDPDYPFRRVRAPGRARWVCSTCDAIDRLEAQDDDESDAR